MASGRREAQGNLGVGRFRASPGGYGSFLANGPSTPGRDSQRAPSRSSSRRRSGGSDCRASAPVGVASNARIPLDPLARSLDHCSAAASPRGQSADSRRPAIVRVAKAGVGSVERDHRKS